MKSIGSLITLLEVCSDNNEEAKKLQLLTGISQSPYYKTLSTIPALLTAYNDYYAMEKLESLELDELASRESAMALIASLYARLVACIQSGNAPELSIDDKPDLTSSESIIKTLGKIQVVNEEQNYTNIDKENIWTIFSENTIKSAQECFDMLPVSLSISESLTEEAIKEQMGDKRYCINCNEFDSIHDESLSFYKKSMEVLTKEKNKKIKSLIFKTAVVMILFCVVYAFQQFGLISDDYMAIYRIVFLSMAAIYMVWG